ncbi:MAG: hypothetical protein ACLR1V_00405 [Coprococcus sp.]
MRDEMKLTMNAIAENEYFARVAVAAFSAKMDPTMEELADIKNSGFGSCHECRRSWL